MAAEDCGQKEEVKLLGASQSPFVTRVRMALALKGIDYEFIEENMQNKSELLLQSNPVHKKIPVLIHNGKPVCESMIIVEYIEETWGNKAPNLLPKDPYDRAIARFWAGFVHDKMSTLKRVYLEEGEGQQKAVEESVTNFLWLEKALQRSGKAYFGGDEIGVVDLALGSLSTWIKALQMITNIVLIDPQKMPLLSAWMERFPETDGVKQVLPDPTKTLEFASAMKARFAAPPAGN